MQAAIALFGSRPTSGLMHLGKFAVKEPHLHRSGPQMELPLDFSHSRLQPTRGADLQLDGSSVLYHFFSGLKSHLVEGRQSANYIDERQGTSS
jgi:hypothetical protein